MRPPAKDAHGAVDRTARAKRLRDRAEECRALAQMMISEANAAAYLRFGDAYEALAKQQDQLARDVAELKPL